MSRHVNCWDNAPQESFFCHMKDEIDLKSCLTFAELEASIDNYMDYSEGNFDTLRNNEILTFDEIIKICRSASKLCIRLFYADNQKSNAWQRRFCY